MNINRYTKIFIKNIMLGLGNVHLSLFDKDQIFGVLQKAYTAMSPRTLVKTPSATPLSSRARLSVLSDLSQIFVDYFKAPAPANQADFDEWHKDTCKWFVREFNLRVTAPASYMPIEYGKAQKIVNVAFKYLYLFSQMTEGYPNHFAFCHFTVDGDTLKWYKKCVCKRGIAKPGKSWSNMKYPDYISIQDNVRLHLSVQKILPKEPFFAEFEIWSEYAF